MGKYFLILVVLVSFIGCTSSSVKPTVTWQKTFKSMPLTDHPGADGPGVGADK